MAKKNKGEWPYHEDRHGNWIPCSSNPCKLHSGGDIMATSPEDAFAKADRMAHPQGGAGLTGTNSTTKTFDPGAAEAQHVVQTEKAYREKTRNALETVCVEPATPPESLRRKWNGTLMTGGKYLETKDLSKGKVADLIRHDVSLLKKADGMPRDWDVSVKVRPKKAKKGNLDSDFDITITRPKGSTPAYRSIRPSDVYDPDNEGTRRSDVRYYMQKTTGKKDCTYDQAVKFCNENKDYKVMTVENESVRESLQKLARQYGMNGISARSRIGRSEHDSTIHFVDKENASLR